MSGKTYVGVNGIAKAPKAIYVGVNGVARKVKAAYVGVNGVAKKIYPNTILPTGYQAIEYIQNTNPGDKKKVFNTGIKPDINTRLILDFEITSYNTTSKQVAAAYYGGNISIPTNLYGIYMTKVGSNYSLFGGFYDEAVLKTSEDINDIVNNRFIVDINRSNGSIYLNNNLVKTITATFDEYSNEIILFGFSVPSGIIEGRSIVKIYSCQIYKKNVLVRDFQPARRLSDYNIGLYDKANEIFYAGNNFYAGPDI